MASATSVSPRGGTVVGLTGGSGDSRTVVGVTGGGSAGPPAPDPDQGTGDEEFQLLWGEDQLRFGEGEEDRLIYE